ncbi:hypothetical protein Bca4012_009837 [Brassica carinata]|uniref:Uncharacterized protein n=1 Tax=Brassica carinata TaxID=52824 RepID=A0A8X7S2Q0_BRACI|nr:hypothetical protein Bca52824_083267 [Brassica carinata]KAG2298587.1 hypothetical protein Bca52824_035059 [Brassica carinata]
MAHSRSRWSYLVNCRNSRGEAKRGEVGVDNRELLALSHESLRFKKIAKEASATEDLVISYPFSCLN